MTAYPNPKRDHKDPFGRNLWYPYYAGYSAKFAASAISSSELKQGAVVADPWNGAGTTTWAARHLGFNSWGADLNPAMAIVAKAKALGHANCLSAQVLAERIIRRVTPDRATDYSQDPLSSWIHKSLVAELRALERAIQEHLVPNSSRLKEKLDPVDFSELTSFFYLALFLLARGMAKDSRTSNPTWCKPSKSGKAGNLKGQVVSGFRDVIAHLINQLGKEEQAHTFAGVTTLSISSSLKVPLPDSSVELVLTSPPYCTRIDYAVATAIELAVLGYSPEAFDSLRRMLIGTTTVPKTAPPVQKEWGNTCCEFLSKVKNHKSHASASYYYKSHIQYFHGLYKSLSEIRRILKRGHSAIMVVQDSQYKEIHNDLAQIMIEMCESIDMPLQSRADFAKPLTLRSVHPHSRKYSALPPTETVLKFLST